MVDEKSKLKSLSNIASIDITLEFDAVLQNILKITCETMNAHSGTMMLVDENNELVMVASYGLAHDYPKRVHEAAKKAGVSLTFSPSGAVLETGKCYLVPNVFKEPRCTPWDDLSKEFGFSSQIFTPMKRGLKVIGLLNVYMADPHHFTEEEINFVTIAASQASSVVQNARMCTSLKSNIQELKEYKERLEEKIKETHEKLYDSERYLRAIIESSLDGIAVMDEQGRIEFGNDSFFNIIGWPRKKIIGQFFIKIVPYDINGFCLNMWHEVQSGAGDRSEARIKTKDGEMRYLLVSHALAEIKGKKKCVVIVKNISEYKKLELELKESEARYRELFENASDFIWTSDVKGRLLAINNSGLDIFGCTRYEIIGTHFSKWFTPESIKAIQEYLEKQISGEVVEQPINVEAVSKNGGHRWLEIGARAIKEGDSITGIHGIGRDITEKKILEQRLKKYHEKLKKSYEELKEADRMKTEFISNISHELFTPITSINGFVELLHDDAMGRVNDEQKRCLEIIHRNADRLSRLIKELLDAARLEKNDLEFQFGFVSLNSILLKSIEDIYPQAKNKQITIIQNIGPLPLILGDEERLTQVTINLLANAIKFTPQRGRITVTAGEDTDQIKISIRDTGIGIPADKLSRIFDRFYQIDGSTSRKYGGIGLGLSICKGIIEKHNGLIWAESDGNGSTFHVVLPKTSEEGNLDA